MQIELASCPVCGNRYDPLRARAVAVLDGRVHAFCSPQCRERRNAAPQPAHPITDTFAFIKQRKWWRLESTGAKASAAATVFCLAFAIVLVRSRRGSTSAAGSAAPAAARAIASPASKKDSVTDVWTQPLARAKRHRTVHERSRFAAASEGIAADECGGGRCGVDIKADAGEVVMAVHDGVIAAVERDQGGDEGRVILISHHGGAVVSIYMHLDGIREDLSPGIPVKAAEPIGTVAAGVKPGLPHLGFAVRVRSADGSELFIDPQPMLIIWPIRDHAPTSLRRMLYASPPR